MNMKSAAQLKDEMVKAGRWEGDTAKLERAIALFGEAMANGHKPSWCVEKLIAEFGGQPVPTQQLFGAIAKINAGVR